MQTIRKVTDNVGERIFVKRLPLTGWGRFPSKDYKVTISIDVDKLIEGLGNKAMRNKSKKSKQFGVLVVVQSVASDD